MDAQVCTKSTRNISRECLVHTCCKNELKKISEDIQSPLVVCQPLGKALVEGCKKRFDEYFKINEWILAAVSTPQFKLNWLTHDLASKKDFAKQLLLEEVRRIHEEQIQNTTPGAAEAEAALQRSTSSGGQNKHDDFDTYFDPDESDAEVPNDYCETLVQSYLQAAGPNQKELSLLQNYPEIRTIYQKFNVGTPSSAPVERFFSKCGRVFRNDRSRLTDRNFEAHALLHANKAKVTELIDKVNQKEGSPMPKKSK